MSSMDLDLGCGCIDMVFCAHQLVGKAIEHNAMHGVLSFCRFTKACDSVP